jgi:hypothetical protein
MNTIMDISCPSGQADARLVRRACLFMRVCPSGQAGLSADRHLT